MVELTHSHAVQQWSCFTADLSSLNGSSSLHSELRAPVDVLFFYFFILFIFLLSFKHSCVHFSLPPSSAPLTPSSHPQPHPPSTLLMGPLYMFFDDPSPSFPHYPLPPPFWLLSVCSLFQCLCLYFACLFVLLIKFLLKVRSYGICLSLPGLFHLA